MMHDHSLHKKNLVTFVLATVAMFVLTGATCNNNQGKITPNPPKVTDQDQCAAACENLRFHGCVEGNPIDMGTVCRVDDDCKGLHGKPDPLQACAANGKCMVSCTNFCIDTENQGVWLDPTCVRLVTSCDQIESCPTPTPRQPTCIGPGCALDPSFR